MALTCQHCCFFHILLIIFVHFLNDLNYNYGLQIAPLEKYAGTVVTFVFYNNIKWM